MSRTSVSKTKRPNDDSIVVDKVQGSQASPQKIHEHAKIKTIKKKAVSNRSENSIIESRDDSGGSGSLSTRQEIQASQRAMEENSNESIGLNSLKNQEPEPSFETLDYFPPTHKTLSWRSDPRTSFSDFTLLVVGVENSVKKSSALYYTHSNVTVWGPQTRWVLRSSLSRKNESNSSLQTKPDSDKAERSQAIPINARLYVLRKFPTSISRQSMYIIYNG